MAVFYPHAVRCACGNNFVVHLADSINIKRSPELRQKILRAELHRAACPACGHQMTVEKPFYYSDIARNAFFKVMPRNERHMWKQASKSLDAAMKFVPEFVSGENDRTLRVVFGMDELREKLVAQDANFDDRFVELLKVFLIYEHPVLLRRARLRLSLIEVTAESVEFLASYEHHRQQFRLRFPRDIVDDLTEKSGQLRNWVNSAHPKGSMYKEPDHWVNMWRWSPQPSALDQLQQYAADVRSEKQINTDEGSFQRMLDRLPRGTHLPPWAKKDLRTLYEYSKRKRLQALEDKLFEIRFGIALEDDWSVNDNADDIDTIWKLLEDLPDSNVEGNTKIHEILLDSGEGGGLYDPTTYDIAIGSRELTNREGFEDVMRHEVGHAVHEMNDKLVNEWLSSRFGWRIFDTSDDGINEWVGLMGGWGGLTAAEQRQVRQYLRTALGNGSSWHPGSIPAVPSGHPWHGANFGPRLAFEKTGANWFQHYKNWYRANGQAFYLNFWYRTFMVVNARTLELVDKMPSNYASMSHFEFFAELYALYYDLDDEKRKAIPTDIGDWLKEKIGASDAGIPRPRAPVEKREWETVTRPLV